MPPEYKKSDCDISKNKKVYNSNCGLFEEEEGGGILRFVQNSNDWNMKLLDDIWGDIHQDMVNILVRVEYLGEVSK